MVRLGSYPCKLQKERKLMKYTRQIQFMNAIVTAMNLIMTTGDRWKKAGFIFSGTSPDGHLVEIIELADHPWFVGCQFHPEFKSRPTRPQPLFYGFIEAALAHKATK